MDTVMRVNLTAHSAGNGEDRPATPYGADSLSPLPGAVNAGGGSNLLPSPGALSASPGEGRGGEGPALRGAAPRYLDTTGNI